MRDYSTYLNDTMLRNLPHVALLRFGVLASLIVPVTLFAQIANVFDIFPLFQGWLSKLALLFLAGAIMLFFWGLVRFIYSAGDERARAEGKRMILWGILAFVVVVSLWGLVWFIQNTLNLWNGKPPYRDKNGNII